MSYRHIGISKYSKIKYRGWMLLHGKLSTAKGFLQPEKFTTSEHSIPGEGAPRPCMIYDICDPGKGDPRARYSQP